MNLEELVKTFHPDWYLDPDATACSGLLQVLFVKVRCEDCADMKVGLVLERGGFAVFLPLSELPVLSDVLSGVASRMKLQ